MQKYISYHLTLIHLLSNVNHSSLVAKPLLQKKKYFMQMKMQNGILSTAEKKKIEPCNIHLRNQLQKQGHSMADQIVEAVLVKILSYDIW